MLRVSQVFFITLVFTVHFQPTAAQADIINVGTSGNANNWFITGAGAVASPSFQTSVDRIGAITLTDNAHDNGTFISGGSLAAFNGFWFADTTFTLPANAVGISLSFDSLYGNDRVVLQLNGTTIGNATNLQTSGVGVMSFTSGADAPFTFTNTSSGIVNGGFVTGTNTLRMIINNTGAASISAPTHTFSGKPGDVTTAFVNASVNFSSVPEPSAAVPLLLGMWGCAGYRRRRFHACDDKP